MEIHPGPRLKRSVLARMTQNSRSIECQLTLGWVNGKDFYAAFVGGYKCMD